MLKRILFAAVFMLCAVPAFATRTFYVSYALGNDSNNGTSTATPWKSIPTMPCGSGWNSTTITGDDIIILRGGETWNATNGCLTWAVGFTGSSGHPVTITTTPSWYTGGAWARPIMDVEFLGGIGWNLGFSSHSYITIENIEFKRVKATTPNSSGLIVGFGAHNIIMNNLYVHGWKLTGGVDGIQGGLIFVTFDTGADYHSIELHDSLLENSEMTGTGFSGGEAINEITTITGTTFHDMSSLGGYACNVSDSFWYNIGYPAGNVTPDGTWHPDAIQTDPLHSALSSCTVQRNVAHDVGLDGIPGLIYSLARESTSVYIINNVLYGVTTNGNDIVIDNYDCYPTCAAGGSTYIWNNTIDASLQGGASPHPTIRVLYDGVRRLGYNNLEIKNNHLIGGSGILQLDGGGATYSGALTQTTNLPNDTSTQPPATAMSQGYVVATLYAPQNGMGGTVGTGTDLSASFTTTYTGATRTVPWDIGAYQWVLTGVTYYVATTGDDSHAGTIGSPFLTIQHCLGIMASGDTCIARGGHYSGFAVGYSYTTTGTSWDIPNTFMGYPGETVTIDCSPLTDNAILFNGIPGGTTLMYWILKDFVVDGTNGLLSSGADGSALIDGGGWYVRIQNVELSYPPRVGISNGANSNYWELLNLNVHHARTLAANDTGHGAYMKGDYLLVDGGIWHDNTGYGLQIYNGGTPVSYAVVRNARIYNNYTGHLRTIQHGGGGMVMGSGAGDVAYNDLIYDNFGNGLDIDYRCGLFDSNFMTVPCEVYNNSIYGNEQSAITLGKDDPPMCNPFSTPAGGPCTMATVKNNICYGNTNGCITDIQSISTQANNLTSNPSYTNAGSSDFTLTSGSVARGYGLNLTSLAISGLLTDFADVARPAVAAWDAGAYQFAATMSLSIIPSTGTKGDSVAIVMTGVSTNWVNGTSTCSFNSATNITVISTVVASATSATCNIAISSSAASTARDIIMTTDTEVVTLTNGFTVLNIPSLVGGKVRGRFH